MAANKFSTRCDLTAKVVEEAIALAIAGKTPRFDYCDNSQPYFVLRVRAHSLSWLVKTRENSIKIGNAMPPEKRKRPGRKPGDGSLPAAGRGVPTVPAGDDRRPT